MAAEKMWVKFFTDAGLPSGISATYALTFVDNRIQMNMLLDLNKDYLKEMGIVCLGDVIAILRHAKYVHEMAARDRVLGKSTVKTPIEPMKLNENIKKIESNATSNNLPLSLQTTVAPEQIKKANSPIRHTEAKPSPRNSEVQSRRETPVERSNGIGSKRKIISTSLPSLKEAVEREEENKISKDVSHHKMKRLSLEHNDVHDTLKRKSSNVFTRLGTVDNTKAKTDVEDIVATQPKLVRETVGPKNIFSRLGEKDIRAAKVDVPPVKNIVQAPIVTRNPIVKADVIQSPTITRTPIVQKKIVINSNGSTRTLSKVPSTGTMRADRMPVNIKEKLVIGLAQKKSVKFSPHIDYKLIENRIESSIQTDDSNINYSFIRQNRNPVVNKVGVFDRLGIPLKRKSI